MVGISEFRLIAGVSIPDVSAVGREYKLKSSKMTFSLSAEDYGEFFARAVKLIKEPLCFFAEIPSDNDSVRTYYLDNCTEPVAQAICRRRYKIRLLLTFGRRRDIYAGIPDGDGLFREDRGV